VFFYDAGSKRRIKQIQVGDAPLSALSFNSDGVTVACGDADGSIMLYDLRKVRLLVMLLLVLLCCWSCCRWCCWC